MRRCAGIWAVFAIAALPLAACTKPPPPPPAATAQSYELKAVLGPDGVTLTAPSGPVGAGCTGSSGVTVGRGDGSAFDYDAVTKCARKLKTSEKNLRDSTSVRINGASDTRYQAVIDLMDAVRKDDAGELFPDVTFDTPTPVPPRVGVRAAPSVDAGSAPLGTRAGALDEPTAVLVSKTKIIVEDDSVLEYDGAASARVNGVPATFKPEGEAGYYIQPLGERLVKEHDRVAKIRIAAGQGGASELVLIFEPDAPYRLVREVLYTASMSGYDKYHLMVLQTAKK